mgnify:CR=1 FL=1
MAREIKFRGISKCRGELWIYGDIVHKRNGDVYINNPIYGGTDVEIESVGQFTGLLDKNKKEIYEGDIIRSEEYKDVKHVVIYDEKYASFMAVLINEYKDTSIETKCHITQEWIDSFPKIVIGNVIDNKDILKLLKDK